MRWVIGYLSAICVLLLVVSTSVIIPTFFTPFFRWHYAQTNAQGQDIAQEIGISHDDLMYVTVELLAYMRGNRESLDGISVVVEGRTERGSRVLGQNFFSVTEIRHMLDVRVLYDQLFIVRNVSFFALIAFVLCMLLISENPVYLLSRCCREVLVGFLGITVVMAGLISINFERSWDIFHYIFFRGEAANYWRLTPFVDLMINMFPLHFFLYISIFVGVLIFIFSAIIVIAGTLYLRNERMTGFGRA